MGTPFEKHALGISVWQFDVCVERMGSRRWARRLSTLLASGVLKRDEWLPIAPSMLTPFHALRWAMRLSSRFAPALRRLPLEPNDAHTIHLPTVLFGGG